MVLGDTINKEVRAWTGVGIAIILASIILLKIKEQNLGKDNCAVGYNYSHQANTCIDATNTSLANTSVTGTGATVNTFVTALAEPKNWIAIVIIAIIGFSLLLFYKSKQRSK